MVTQEIGHGLDFTVRHKRSVQARDAASPRHIKHVALAQQLLGPLFAHDRSGVDFRGDLEGDPGREVGLDRAGDDVNRRPLRRHDQVNTRGSRHLGQTLDCAFDVLSGHQHQVSDLVNNHDQIGQRFWADLFFLVDRPTRFIEASLYCAFEVLTLGRQLDGLFIVTGYVPHTDLRHQAVAVFHLPHSPFQRHDRLLRVGHHRRQQMGDAIINTQFQHLGVDHDEPALVRGHAIEHRQDHGIHTNRLA